MRKFIAILLCLCTVCMSVGAAVSAKKSETLVISNVDEFLEFAENCRLDSYSVGLTVELEADIDLRGADFSPIPYFGGIFNGNGHTVSGAVINEEGSVEGFFRYVINGAEVNNLTVCADIAPSGSRSMVGGIAGINSGSIINCTFSGSVSGADKVGGIAGINTAEGVIMSCSSKGVVFGSHFVGGIAGENNGIVEKCTNSAEVNTTVQHNSVEISDITLDSLTDSESASTVTDIGGIVGGNTGTVSSCENHAAIGYKHIGYNIGGIAGSQSGYISDCKNTGNISGRKEVGGIAGQIEPTTLIEFSEDTVQILQEQFNAVEHLANQAAAEAESGMSEMASQIESIQNNSQAAQDALGTLLSSLRNPEDINFDAILSAQSTISSSLSQMVETVQNMGDAASENVTAIGEELNAIGNQLSAIGNTAENAEETTGITVADVSDEDTEADKSSKVVNCINVGDIIADLNAGGIAGSMSIENDLDHEEDVEFIGDRSSNVATKFRAVVLSCENSGKVTAKKQNAGGIVGWVSLGLVKDCLNTGALDCEGADYVGAITGQSTGYIRNCSAKCTVYGDRYVGGIAGSAEIVSDCRSMVMVADSAEKDGAVIGYIEDITEIKNNVYFPIGEDLGGIDGISYDGCAQAMGDEFFELPELDDAFKTVKISFVFEDGTVKEVLVETGGEISEEEIPKLPEKKGYTAQWSGIEEIDLTNILFDAVLAAEYISKQPIFQSTDIRADGRPILLVQGTVENMTLSEITNEVYLPTEQAVLEAWSYEMGENSVAEVLRFLPEKAYGEKDISVFILNDSGEWEKTSFTVNGSYVVFDTSDISGAFCLAEAPPDYTRLIQLAASAVCVIILIIILLCRRAMKRKKAKE